MSWKICALIAVLIWNFIVFVIYGIDKQRAKNNKWRISEHMLLTMALFLGAVGAFIGMQAFRHKTLKPKFKLVYLFLAVNIAVYVVVFFVV